MHGEYLCGLPSVFWRPAAGTDNCKGLACTTNYASTVPGGEQPMNVAEHHKADQSCQLCYFHCSESGSAAVVVSGLHQIQGGAGAEVPICSQVLLQRETAQQRQLLYCISPPCYLKDGQVQHLQPQARCCIG